MSVVSARVSWKQIPQNGDGGRLLFYTYRGHKEPRTAEYRFCHCEPPNDPGRIVCTYAWRAWQLSPCGDYKEGFSHRDLSDGNR